MSTRRLRVHGKVQGVCYRHWAVQTARSLGLYGWVRNRIDGTVEAVIAGRDEDIHHFIEQAYDGPPSARVSRIDQQEEPDFVSSGFEQRPTE